MSPIPPSNGRPFPTGLTFRAWFTVRNGCVRDFTQIVEALQDKAKSEPGTITYQWQPTADPSRFFVLEQFADPGAIDIHVKNCAELLAQLKEVTTRTAVEAIGASRGTCEPGPNSGDSSSPTQRDKQRKSKKGMRAVYRLLKRFWIPLLLVIVVGIGGYAIAQIRSSATPRPPKPGEGSGITANFNPKHITYEIVGTGGTANLNYLDENGQPHLVENAPLPWSFTIVTTMPSMSANIVAQGDRNVSGLGCRVTVDGGVRDDRTSTDKVKPFIYCLVKSV